ncbi:hypothetical protein LFM09_41350 [Lentzea alba]|uniref:hypothetical protein n=1 Tax=Lentzea alba TaxID=2714351 RepID=UPI0039BF6D73
MTDAEVLDQVLGLLRPDVGWTEAGLASAVEAVDLGEAVSTRLGRESRYRRTFVHLPEA